LWDDGTKLHLLTVNLLLFVYNLLIVSQVKDCDVSQALPPSLLLDPNEEVTAIIVDDVESVGFGCEPLSYDQYKKVRIMGRGGRPGDEFLPPPEDIILLIPSVHPPTLEAPYATQKTPK
jgi:hypothetical protein